MSSKKQCPVCGKNHAHHFRPCPVCGERKFSVPHIISELLAVRTKSRKEFLGITTVNLFTLASALRGHEALAEWSKFGRSKAYRKRRMRSDIFCRCTKLCKHGALKALWTGTRLRPRGSKVERAILGWRK